MKFTRLLNTALLVFFGAGVATAQNQPLSDAKIRTNLSQVRFLVNTPSSIGGLKKSSIASWGAQASPAILNIPVVRGVDSLAANPLTNGSAINGKACLLFRGGNISFAQKAQYAESAGAIAVIIVNNVAGDPIQMGNTGTATRNIPIIMVNKADGEAMNNAIIGSSTVTVSIGLWNLTATHDLAILPGFQSGPHALNIPMSQLNAGAARLPYRNFVGGGILNYGTSAETGITIADTVTWNPTGGGSSNVHTGSYSVPNIAAADSFKFGFGASSMDWSLPAPTTTGFFTYKYNLNYANIDQIPQDNIHSFNQYVTDSVFCKGAYDFTRNEPHISLGIQPSGIASAYSLGPLFYMAKGKYYARKMQYYVSKNTVPTLDQEEAYALLYKWVDGANAQPLDSFVEGDELKLVGIHKKSFTTADSNGFVFTVPMLDQNNKVIVLDSNAWYWSTVQATSTCFVGVDETQSFFTRSYIQSNRNYIDQPELLFTQDFSNLSGGTTALVPFPFGGNGYDIDSTFFDRFYYIPNIALHISKNQVGPAGIEQSGSASIGHLNVYPIPANSELNVKLSLTQKAAKVEYRLLDIGGRVVYRSDKADLQADNFKINTGNIPSGIYHLAVFTEAGHTFERVSIHH